MAKIASFSTRLTALLTISGCSGAVWGNLAIFGISIGIFLGTLYLSKPSSK
jgi:hypothetical protein